jgi:branched-chain amino acid transport system permease protein
MVRLGPSFEALAVGSLTGVVTTILLALVMGVFSLRVRAIFFAMVTFAFASAFAVLVSQLSTITGGENGLSYGVPEALTTGLRLLQDPVLGVAINGRLLCYYAIVASSLFLFLALLRIVNSPFGRVLQAIRENPGRSETLGYRVVGYRAAAIVISAVTAAIAGIMQALWLRYTGPATTLSLEIMIDILLIVVIGGRGTIYGAAIGATLLVIAQGYLQGVLAALAEFAGGIPVISNALQPGRWLLWLGLLFVLSVYFFPDGIVGRLRRSSDE